MKAGPADGIPLSGWLMLIILAIIWGSSFILIKFGLIAYSPIEVGALRIVSASLVLTPFALNKMKWVKQHQWKYLLSVGFVGSFFPAFLFAQAQTEIDSAIAGLLNAMTPIFVLMIGALVYRQVILKNALAGIFLGFLGTSLLVLAGSGGSFGNMNFYALFIVLATMFYGFNINLIKYSIKELSALTITSISLMLVGPIALILLLAGTPFIETFSNHPDALISFFAIFMLGVMGTAVALVIFNKLVQVTNPIFASSVTYLIPIVAILLGLLDGEILLLGHYFAMLIILSGVYLANKR